MSAVERPTDGPDTELAAAIAWFREDPKRLDFAPITEWSRHLRTIVRAYLARPDATGGAPKHLLAGDRVETADGSRATVTGSAPRGPRGEPAVNLDWDGDAGGPAYEHDLRRVSDATGGDRPVEDYSTWTKVPATVTRGSGVPTPMVDPGDVPDATGGRDLTADDVAAVVRDYLGLHRTAQRLADRLNGIARPAVARTDAPCQGTCTGCGAGEDQVCTGSCRCVASGVHDRDGYTPDMPEYTAPADDTAAPPAAPRADWSGAWAELTGYVRAATEPIDPARIDAYMVELKREALRPFREWWEQLAAGQPVRDSQDGGA